MPFTYRLISLFLLFTLSLYGQPEDTTASEADDFDFSEFELAAPPSKSFCNNKVLGQSPTTLIGLTYTFQGSQDFTAGNPADNPLDGTGNTNLSESNNLQSTHEFALAGNFPVVSRNNILINLNVLYSEQHYNFTDGASTHPFIQSLQGNPLRSASTLATVFKPLNDKRFLLGQFGMALNGDYSFSNFNQSFNTLRYSAALLYGFKPNDRLMYAFGLVRTYLGGALNYVPVVYYYHTFKNEKWGTEILLPSRAYLRYRFNSTSLAGFGFNVLGNTYRLNYFSEYPGAMIPGNNLAYSEAQSLELRRSEIRLGTRYMRSIKGFFWLIAEAGYRINYSYDVDRNGDFLRFFGNDEPYYIENELGNPFYFTIGISYVSP